MKPKIKILIWAGAALAVAVVVAAALWGRRYYNDRYVGADYYAMVPYGYDMAQAPMYSMSGDEIGNGISYDLTAYDENGEKKQVTFRVYSPESGLSRGEMQPQPGTYLWVSASKTIVLKWREIEEAAVPEAALNMINQ